MAIFIANRLVLTLAMTIVTPTCSRGSGVPSETHTSDELEIEIGPPPATTDQFYHNIAQSAMPIIATRAIAEIVIAIVTVAVIMLLLMMIIITSISAIVSSSNNRATH